MSSESAHIPPSHRIGRKGFLLLFLMVPLVYHPNWLGRGGMYDFALLPKRLLVQLVLAFVALIWAADRQAGQVRPPKASLFHLPIACYLLIMLLAFSQAINPVTGLVALAQQFTFVCLFFLAFELFPLPSFPTLLRIAAGVGIGVSCIGILEARGIDQIWLPLSNGRPSATFAYRNFAASYLIMTLPFTLLLWLRSQTQKDLCLGATATGLMLVFLVYTRTRGAWVGLAGSTLITLFVIGHARYHWKTRFGISNWLIQTPKARTISLAALILAFGLSLLPPRITAQQARLIDEEKVELLDALSFVTTPQADRGRLAMWQNTLSMIQDHPLLGVGPDNWRYLYPRYDGGAMLRADSEPRRPHNDFLWIASELGLFGLAVYVWILGVAAWTVIGILKRAQNPDHAGYAVALGAALLSMLGHSMVSFPKERIETSFLFWLGLGLLAQLDAPKDRSRTPVPISETAWAVYLMPVLLILSVGLTYRHIQFDKHYLRALEFHKGNDFQSVLRESSLALKHGPFESQAFFLQGDGYQAHGSLQEASASYRAGLRYHPNAIQLLGGLGTTYALQNNLDKAEQYYRKALEIYPGYYQMYNNLGGVFQKRGNLDTAIQSYQKALEANQGYLDAYNNLGLAYLAAGRPDDAIQTYQKAILQTPNDAVLHYNLADAYYQKAQHDGSAMPQALASYEQFLRLWTGPRSQAEPARKRVDELRKRLGGGPP